MGSALPDRELSPWPTLRDRLTALLGAWNLLPGNFLSEPNSSNSLDLQPPRPSPTLPYSLVASILRADESLAFKYYAIYDIIS